MCGRFTSELSWSDIAKPYGLMNDGPPHWNFPPNYGRGRVVHHAIAVAKLCCHGSVVAAHEESDKRRARPIPTNGGSASSAEPVGRRKNDPVGTPSRSFRCERQ